MKKSINPGDTLDGYISIRELTVTSLVILSDSENFTDGQRVEILEAAS